MLKKDGWSPQNHAALAAFLDTEAKRPGRKVAVFDWDNTVIKNDIGDAFFIGMLDRGLVADPGDWRRTNPYLTDAAVATLEQGATPELIFTLYNTMKTPAGAPAFAGHDPRITEPAYAWLGHLLAGNTPDAIRRASREIFERQLTNPIGATRRIGNDTIADYIRIYPQIADLIGTLERSGFEVWVVSATPKYIIDPCAAMVGIPPERVIGIENVVGPDGRLTYDLVGCGPYGNDSRIISFRDGKRCWINKVLFGMTTGDPLLPNPDPEKRPRFGAGDSDGDISFLQDTTGLRLFIDKGRPLAAAAAARENADGRWLIQEPFIG